MIDDIMRGILFLPEQASTLAPKIDHLHFVVFLTTMLGIGAVFAVTLAFLYKYRARTKDASTPYVEPGHRYEAAVVILPTILFLAWVVVGIRDVVWYMNPPANTIDVYVTGKKWMWHFAYPDGPNANATLHVPVGRPVRLLLTSRDVIHSFYVPEFRIKQDAVPGRYTETWFEATKPGRYPVYCTEFCGTWHSQMLGEVVVLPQAEYDRWLMHQREGLLASRADSSGVAVPGAWDDVKGDLVAYGRRVAAAQGCLKCHSIDGEQHIGPTWVDLYMRKTTLNDGRVLVADEAYLTESMMDPYTKVVKGYAQVMPSFRGKLSAPEAAALVQYIKSLRGDNLENLAAKEPVYGPVGR